jgi:transposase
MPEPPDDAAHQDWHGHTSIDQKWSRGQVETRLANLPQCPIGMEACVGAHHLNRKLQVLGHDDRLRSDNECSEGKGDGSE